MEEQEKKQGSGYTVTINAYNTITKKQNVGALWAGRLLGLMLTGFSVFGLWTTIHQESPSTVKLVLLFVALVFGMGLVLPEIILPLLMGLVGLYKKARS